MIVYCYLATHINSVLSLAILLKHSSEAIILVFFISLSLSLFFLLFFFLLLTLFFHFVLFAGVTYLSHLLLSLIQVISKIQVDV